MEMNKFYCCKGSAMYLAISLVLTTFGGKLKQLDFVHQTVAGTHARAVAGTHAWAGNETTLLLRPCMMCVVFLLPLAC